MIFPVVLFSASSMGDFMLEDQSQFRLKREQSLKSERGWLSVDGLLWIPEGTSSLGGTSQSSIVLPGDVPASIGKLTRKGNEFNLEVLAGVTVLKNGTEFSNPIQTDDSGRPDLIKVGKVSFSIIKRGTRFGVRVWNPDSEAQRKFKGLDWYEPADGWVVEARFVAHDPPKKISITNILGDTEEAVNSGYVEFSINGKQHRLEAQEQGDSLFFNFKDTTNGKETYGAGRFLYTALPKDGKVTLDFNRATNPPCAYTAFATCPLPPASNYLKIAIPAGEKKPKSTQ